MNGFPPFQAVWYAYEAMSIFEVCLGLEHPFYLQTLALWTFLDTEAPKTDSELLALTKYGDNKPVDLAALLEKANAIVDIHPVQAASWEWKSDDKWYQNIILNDFDDALWSNHTYSFHVSNCLSMKQKAKFDCKPSVFNVYGTTM